jgi:hypothetical protein
VQKDLRFKTLLDLVFSRLPELAYEYVVTNVWSMGICVSAFGLELPEEFKLRLLTVLNAHIDSGSVDPSSYANIPTLVFSLTCFFTPEEKNELVTETVEKLSKIYCDIMLERMDLLKCSNLLMSWGRSFMRNEELLERVSEEIFAKHR